MNKSTLNAVSSNVPTLNPLLYWTDSYKVSHITFETEGVKEIYSNFTPRFSTYLENMLGSIYDKQYVVFGVQYLVLRMHAMFKNGFFDRPKDEVISEMKSVLGPYIGQEKYDHFEKLHDLGYLPIVIKALDEGTLAPVGVPFFTIRNTHPEFEWLPNYLESGISSELWKPLTVATIGRSFRQISNKFALETTGSIEGTEWQNHDFSFRGQAGFESSAINGVGFLLSSYGTDNIPALWAANTFYNSNGNEQLLAGSVPAGEHSVTTSGILTEQERLKEWSGGISGISVGVSLEDAEYLYTKKLLTERFPKGIFSYVADSYDYWTFVTKIIPRLKDEILARDGKFVVRGDSGNPIHIIAGYRIKTVDTTLNEFKGLDLPYYIELFNRKTLEAYKNGYEVVFDSKDGRYYKILHDNLSGLGLTEIGKDEALGTIEVLYNIFGGTTNDLGFKLLDSHIGMIYGDGINVQRSQEILTRLKEKGYASTNIVFGVGSYSLNMLSRDHLGMAIKATNTIVEINGANVDKPIYKDPKTDTSKKSAKGLMMITEENGKLKLTDGVSRELEDQGLLTEVYRDGELVKLTDVFEIRNRLWK